MKSKYGFTLVELFVTLFIASIVVMYAIPGFGTFLKDNRLTTQTNLIVAAMNVAKSEAISKSITVTLCASDATQSTRSCDTNNWEKGWILFTDQDADRTVDSGVDTLIRTSDGSGSSITIRTTDMENAGYVQYTASGFIYDDPAITAQDPNGSFKICDNRGASKAMAVNVSNTGIVKTAKDTNSDGIVNIINGTNMVNITCP